MTKKQITTDLNNKISEFFEESNVDNLIILKGEIHNIFSAIPFNDALQKTKETELELLGDTFQSYIKSDLSESTKKLLSEDFHRLVITVFLSLLEK